jgi:hypothetical protein
MSDPWEAIVAGGRQMEHARRSLAHRERKEVLDRATFDRELAAKIGELREVKTDMGSFLSVATEATNEQRLAIAEFVHRFRPQVKRVTVTPGGAGLPRSYMHVQLFDGERWFYEAGVDEEGRVST